MPTSDGWHEYHLCMCSMQPKSSNFKPTEVSELRECACACKWVRFTIWVIHPLSNAESAWYEPLTACGVCTSLEVSDSIVRFSSWQQDQSLHHAEQGKHVTLVRNDCVLKKKLRRCLAAYKKFTKLNAIHISKNISFPFAQSLISGNQMLLIPVLRHTDKKQPRLNMQTSSQTSLYVQKPVKETSFLM